MFYIVGGFVLLLIALTLAIYSPRPLRKSFDEKATMEDNAASLSNAVLGLVGSILLFSIAMVLLGTGQMFFHIEDSSVFKLIQALGDAVVNKGLTGVTGTINASGNVFFIVIALALLSLGVILAIYAPGILRKSFDSKGNTEDLAMNLSTIGIGVFGSIVLVAVAAALIGAGGSMFGIESNSMFGLIQKLGDALITKFLNDLTKQLSLQVVRILMM